MEMDDPELVFKSRCTQISGSRTIVKFLQNNHNSVFLLLCSSIIELLEKVHVSRGSETDEYLLDYLGRFQEQNKIKNSSLLALSHTAKVVALTLRTLHEAHNGVAQTPLLDPQQELENLALEVPSTSENIVVSASAAGPIEREIKEEPQDEDDISPNLHDEDIMDDEIKKEANAVEIAPATESLALFDLLNAAQNRSEIKDELEEPSGSGSDTRCELCGEIFGDCDELNNHFVQCQLVANLDQFADDPLGPNGRTRYKCSDCNRFFTKRIHAKRHCDEACGGRPIIMSSSLAHSSAVGVVLDGELERDHIYDIFQYKCACGDSFVNKTAQSRHATRCKIALEERKKKEETAITKPERNVVCIYCHQGFYSDAELEGHRLYCVYAEGAVSEEDLRADFEQECDYCGKMFSDAGKFRRHRTYCATVDRTSLRKQEECEFCQQGFHNRDQVIAHKKFCVFLMKDPDPNQLLYVPKPKLSEEERRDRRRKQKAISARKKYHEMTPEQKAAYCARKKKTRMDRKRQHNAESCGEPYVSESDEDDVDYEEETVTSLAKRKRT